jgi:hypothetical protein
MVFAAGFVAVVPVPCAAAGRAGFEIVPALLDAANAEAAASVKTIVAVITNFFINYPFILRLISRSR